MTLLRNISPTHRQVPLADVALDPGDIGDFPSELAAALVAQNPDAWEPVTDDDTTDPTAVGEPSTTTSEED